MSSVMHKQSTGVTLRRWQMLVLMTLALLTLLAIIYVTLYSVAHVDLWHMFQPLAIMYGH